MNLTAIEEILGAVPSGFILSQNYPNPFNPTTTIEFSIPKWTNVNLTIYNTLGQEMAVLVNEEREVGSCRVVWNGSQYPSGVYLYQLETSTGFSATEKMLLVK